MGRTGIIAVDAMGGDRAPAIPVEAALLAAREGLSIALVGQDEAISATLHRLGGEVPENLVIHHAPEIIGMDEKPSSAVRKKPTSSLMIAADLVAAGDADALVSAGNSGAVMAAGLFRLGRVPGVQRPAIAAAFPTKKSSVVLLDLGANVDPTPVQLAQFGIMGEAFARTVLGRIRPKVAILANGSEEVKGSDLTRAAQDILQRSRIDFAGYCEGGDVFEGDLDVIITDGFTGNILLKTLEGFVGAVRHLLEREVRGSIAATAGALLMRNILGTIKRKLDYEEAGGALLLGLKKSCVVAHGSSSPNALRNAISAALSYARTDVPAAIEASIEQHAQIGLWPPAK